MGFIIGIAITVAVATIGLCIVAWRDANNPNKQHPIEVWIDPAYRKPRK